MVSELLVLHACKELSMEEFGQGDQCVGEEAHHCVCYQACMHAHIILVSSLKKEYVEKRLLTTASSAKEALKIAFENVGTDAKVLVMPYAGSTLPLKSMHACMQPRSRSGSSRVEPFSA